MNFLPEYKSLNNRIGWLVFLISAIVYTICIEPTASFWDCGEYIACANGLETGHPPGAPFFLLIARFFALFSFGNPELVAPLINFMSGIASAFTILFLFWSITRLAKKILIRSEDDFTSEKKWLVIVAGAVGSLSYAFTDSFWFSAVEGEVYALSSFFTAIVFWAILKWEEVADEAHADRWLIFIAYMIGLSIGVHLLNLLTIPAIVFIWYFRKYEKTKLLGFLITSLVSVLLLGGIQDVLIPGIVNLAGKTELFFVNELGWKFNNGIIFFFSLLVSFILLGLFLSQQFKIVWLNTTLLAFTVLLIGYSSFAILVIRSNAITPINEGNPSNPVSLLSYLNREQYGDWPLFYGPHFNTPLDEEKPYLDGNPVYVKDEKSGKYIISDARKESIPNYDARGCTFFPRMYSRSHAKGYQNIAGVQGRPVIFTYKKKPADTVLIPTAWENMKFFFGYQCGQMYLRYFAWNFVGKQNDRQSSGSDAEGNYILGINPLDGLRLGDQSLRPEFEKQNKANNRYFAIPFLLGLLGFIWHLSTSRRDAFVVGLLFIFTSFSILFYLNQTPWQPRERDYAYVGSFYAWSIWIGLGAIGVFTWLRSTFSSAKILIAASAISFLSPVLLFVQNFDDHNRSGRTVAKDLAINMLESCEQNAILFTYADNDTFPLWYAQEVLGVRRDVRIICLSLFRSDWYIDQAKRKQYNSDPLPISLENWEYRDGTRDYVYISESVDTISIQEAAEWMSTTDPERTYTGDNGELINYIPSRDISYEIDRKAIQENFASYHFADSLLKDKMYWRLRGNYLMKDQITVLDILANNNWKRPVYFAVNMPSNTYAGLDDYLMLEGLAYRMVPVANPREEGNLMGRPQVNMDKCYRLLTNEFSWGGLQNPAVYSDETVARMFASPMRFASAKTVSALVEAGRMKEAMILMNKCANTIPELQVPVDEYWMEFVQAAYVANDMESATRISDILFEHAFKSLLWYQTMSVGPYDMYEQRNRMQDLLMLADEFGNTVVAARYAKMAKQVGN
jgi:Protein of unknown function (DUF2723)